MTAVGSKLSARAPLEDCWNRIGVRGDRSCEKLPDHIHCRNCPVYSAAARSLLDVAPPAGYAAAATAHLVPTTPSVRSTPPGPTAGTNTKTVIVFRVRAEWYALHTAVCLEVADLRPIHSLPHRRDKTVLGVASVRGELLVCVSLAAILGLTDQLGATPTRSRRCAVPLPRLLVTGAPGGTVVFPVDEVQGMERYAARDLKGVPSTVAHARAHYTQGLISLDSRTAGLLDEDLLFSTVERALA